MMFNRIIILFLTSLFYFTNISPSLAEQAPNLVAEMAIMIDASTGRVLYEKNADMRAYPASTTKLLTLVTALDYNNQRPTVRVSRYAASMEGSSMYLRANETYPFTEILYGMMLESGNDAAVVVAEHIAGDINSFARLMNIKARNIGMRNSNFVNPSGLPNDNHYTTARDLSILARYAMQNPTIMQIVGTYKRPWQKKNFSQPSVITNTNMLLDRAIGYYGATGMKTGYTSKARRCLIASVERNGVSLIVVLLKSETYCWNDARKLFDYGFSQVNRKVIYKAGEVIDSVAVYRRKDKVEVTVEEDLVLTSFEDDFDNYTIEVLPTKRLFVPVEQGQEAGIIRILYKGKEVKTVNLVAKSSVD